MDPGTLTLLVDEHVTELPARIGAAGEITVDAADLERATGWELRDEGLCRGRVCVPVRDRAALVADGGVSLAGFAAALHRALATEPAAGFAVLGGDPGPADDRDGLEAPPFTLPDVDGRPVSLSDHAGRKRLLVFWSSW